MNPTPLTAQQVAETAAASLGRAHQPKGIAKLAEAIEKVPAPLRFERISVKDLVPMFGRVPKLRAAKDSRGEIWVLTSEKASCMEAAAAPDLLAACESAPIIRLGETFEAFAERYKVWHREVLFPAIAKAHGGVA